MRPPPPEPVTVVRSTPSSRANLRTPGLAATRPPVDTGAAAGTEPTVFTSAVGLGAFATGAGAGMGAEGAVVFAAGAGAALAAGAPDVPLAAAGTVAAVPPAAASYVTITWPG